MLKLLKKAWECFFDWLSNSEPHASLDKAERELFEGLERDRLARKATKKVLGIEKVKAIRLSRPVACMMLTRVMVLCKCGCQQENWMYAEHPFPSLAVGMFRFSEHQRVKPHIESRFVVTHSEIERLCDHSLPFNELLERRDRFFDVNQSNRAEAN